MKKLLFITLFVAGFIQIQAQKNVIFILTDDQGYNQLGCYGSDYYESPHIDKIATNGMRFEQGYSASPVCSPTRASIMSGKYPARLHLTDWLNGYGDKDSYLLNIPAWKMYLDKREVTIAEKLQENGYKTGFWGKWHIAKESDIQAYYGFGESIPYHNPSFSDFDSDHMTGSVFDDDYWDDAHSTMKIADRAVAFLEANKEEPMFLYVSYNAIHTPIVERDSLVKKYQQKEGAELSYNNPILGAMIETVDVSVGKIYDKVEELGLLDSTIFIYFSDNGCRTADAPVPPLNGGKTQLLEGGVRMPTIVSWQNTIPAGTVSQDYIISTDFYTTILDLLGTPYNVDDYPDSKSFINSLKQKPVDGVRPIFWHHPHYHPENADGPQGAIRQGDYKLIVYYEEYLTGQGDPFDLFDIKNDIGETKDLSNVLPELTDSLNRLFIQWKKEVSAQEPTVKGELIIPDGNYYIQCLHSGKVIGVKDGSTSQSANIVQESLTESLSQQWHLREGAGGFYTIDNKNSGYLMSVDGWSQEPEANVSVWGTYAGQQNQSCRHWRFVEVGNGIYEIIARHAGLYLEVADSSVSDGANMQINDYQNGAAHMQFRLIPAEEEERLDDGVYYIEEVQSGKVLAVANASTEQSASVISEEYTNSKSQHWIFRHQDNGFFTFDNELSNYLMCVGGWGTSPGDAVVVWGTEASHSQQTCRQWKLNKNDDGTYHIFGKHSELFLEVKDDNKVQINTLDELRKMSFNIHKVGESLLNSTSASALTIYPNPCNDYLNIQLSVEYKGCYNIYNTKGMVVSKGVVSSPDFPSIDCTLLIPGHYYLEFIMANNKKACHFIKI